MDLILCSTLEGCTITHLGPVQFDQPCKIWHSNKSTNTSLSLSQPGAKWVETSWQTGEGQTCLCMGNGCEHTLFLHGIEFLGCLQFFRQFGPYWCDNATHLLQIWWLHNFVMIFINRCVFFLKEVIWRLYFSVFAAILNCIFVLLI